MYSIIVAFCLQFIIFVSLILSIFCCSIFFFVIILSFRNIYIKVVILLSRAIRKVLQNSVLLYIHYNTFIQFCQQFYVTFSIFFLNSSELVLNTSSTLFFFSVNNGC